MDLVFISAFCHAAAPSEEGTVRVLRLTSFSLETGFHGSCNRAVILLVEGVVFGHAFERFRSAGTRYFCVCLSCCCIF